jgi:pilus assembly protein CpaC
MIRTIITSILIVMMIVTFNPVVTAQDLVQPRQAADTKVIHMGMNLRTINVPNGKGQLISVPDACKTVSVGNPLICDVVMLGEKDFLLVGKNPGETNVYVWLENDMKLESTIKVFDSTVDLVNLLSEILPYEKDIKVSMAHNTVILSGYVMKPTSIESAQKISEAYMAGRDSTSKIDVKVVNMLKVKDEKQIMLEVRFAEVIRTASDDTGFDWRYVGDVFGNPADLSFLEGGTSSYSGLIEPGEAPWKAPLQNGAQGTSWGSTNWDNGASTFYYGLDYIEAHGLGKIIAKPNLLVRNGEEASFLAGGEFPVPVQQEDSVQIEWKEFGVKLKFTPFIDERDNIHLEMIPEVSVLDFSEAAVSVNGFNIPALKTRRTETKIVLREGQSFCVSGLISQSETDSLSTVPGIDQIPILGNMFRKKENTKAETELIVFVTPRIVNPVDGTIKKDFTSEEKMRLMTNSMSVPFEQAHGDAIKDFFEQGEKPEKSLETLREEEIMAELERLEAERVQAEEAERLEKERLKAEKRSAFTGKAKSAEGASVAFDRKDEVDLSKIDQKRVVQISNIELQEEHTIKKGTNEEAQPQKKKKRGFFSFFKRKAATEEEQKESVSNDILAEVAVHEDTVSVEKKESTETLTLATSEDITASVHSAMSYLDDISEELHELSAVKG